MKVSMGHNRMLGGTSDTTCGVKETYWAGVVFLEPGGQAWRMEDVMCMARHDLHFLAHSQLLPA